MSWVVLPRLVRPFLVSAGLGGNRAETGSEQLPQLSPMIVVFVLFNPSKQQQDAEP